MGVSLLICALAALAGCGGSGDGGTTGGAGDSPVADATHRADAGTRAGGDPTAAASVTACPRQLTAFVGSLDALRHRLEVGLTYERYAAAVRRLRGEYGAIPVGRLRLPCLTRAGAPGERAFDEYIAAANLWGECLAEAGCDASTVEPRLQARWRVAAAVLARARGAKVATSATFAQQPGQRAPPDRASPGLDT